MGAESPHPQQRRAERLAAADAHAAALQRTQQAETAEAAALIARFVDHATKAGIGPVPLLALGYGGRRRYRTSLEGWYLRRDCTIGVGTDGSYYILKAPDTAIGRLRGIELPPTDPPLIVGKGGRDGESIDLKTLLAQRLAAGADWPRP